MLREFARWADISALNMEDDGYLPFQGLADILTVRERKVVLVRGCFSAISLTRLPSLSRTDTFFSPDRRTAQQSSNFQLVMALELAW